MEKNAPFIDHIIPDDTVPMNPETVENPKDYDQEPAVPIPQVVPTALPNMDFSGDSDLSTPNMDTEHTPVDSYQNTGSSTEHQSETYSYQGTPSYCCTCSCYNKVSSGRVIRPAKKLLL